MASKEEFSESTDTNAKGLTEKQQEQMISDMRQKVNDSPTFSKLAPQDIERVQSPAFDWWYRRFLDRYDWDLDVTAPCFIEALKWRKDQGVNDISVLGLKHMFDLQSLYIRGVDKDGQPCLWFSLRNHVKSKPTKDKQDTMTFWIEKHYFETKGSPMVIVFDLYNSGMGQTDLDGVRFLLNLLKFYYPGALAYLLVYEIPWVLNAAWKVIKSWLDAEAQKRIIFITKKEIGKYITADNLPVHCGGTLPERERKTSTE